MGGTGVEKRSDGVDGDTTGVRLMDTLSFGHTNTVPSLRALWRNFRCPRPTLLGLLGTCALVVFIMLFTWIIEAALFSAYPALASPNSLYGSSAKVPLPGPDGKYVLQAEGIRATFIPYGASISNLFLNDSRGVERDIVLGFDNATYYSEDKSHPHLGGVPGRYANRIKNRCVLNYLGRA